MKVKGDLEIDSNDDDIDDILEDLMGSIENCMNNVAMFFKNN